MIEIGSLSIGALLVVLGVEVLVQGQDNSWNVFRKSKGRRFEMLSWSIYLLRLNPLIWDLLLLGFLIRLKDWLQIHSLDMYVEKGLLSQAGLLILGLLFYDFLQYWSHRFKHRSRFFWIFHRWHHSTTELHALAHMRVHTLDYPLRTLSVAFPTMFVMGVSFENVLWLWFAEEISQALCHSRINTDYGFLGKIFANPRSHRRHHDIADDQGNFGLVFSFWDRIFGTARDDSESFAAQTGTYFENQNYEEQGALKMYFQEYRELGKWFLQKLLSLTLIMRRAK